MCAFAPSLVVIYQDSMPVPKTYLRVPRHLSGTTTIAISREKLYPAYLLLHHVPYIHYMYFHAQNTNTVMSSLVFTVPYHSTPLLVRRYATKASAPSRKFTARLARSRTFQVAPLPALQHLPIAVTLRQTAEEEWGATDRRKGREEGRRWEGRGRWRRKVGSPLGRVKRRGGECMTCGKKMRKRKSSSNHHCVLIGPELKQNIKVDESCIVEVILM